MSAWFVYLIECRGARIYTGIAIDVAARYAAHAQCRGARFTRAHPPQRLLASFRCADRSTASRAEAALKRWDPARKRALCAGPADIDLPALLGLSGDAIDVAE
jgi:putative endonuclease